MTSKFVYAAETCDEMERINRKSYRDSKNYFFKNINFRCSKIKTLNEEVITIYTGKSKEWCLRLYKILKSSIME